MQTTGAPPQVVPVTSYYLPPPVVTYSPPPYVTYSAPYVTYAPTYSAPLYVQPGVVTTRTYTGFGIFRPRGVYTESYIAPIAPRTSYYYPPLLWR